MKRVFLFLICCILTTACSLNKPMPISNATTENDQTIKPSPTAIIKADGKVIDYFSYAKDVHMIYKGTGNEYASYDTYIDYLRIMSFKNEN